MTPQNEPDGNLNDLFRGRGIQIKLKKPDDFLKIKETLTRIGVASRKEKKIWQSCHILHKRDPQGNSHYAILHFKELFLLDGKSAKFDELDIPRRNSIIRLLEQWNLVEIVNQIDAQELAPMNTFKVLSFKEKQEWQLLPKYEIGTKSKGK